MSLNKGDVVKHKSSDFKMVVIQVEEGYSGPDPKRVLCSYWDVNKNEFVQQKFVPYEVELLSNE